MEGMIYRITEVVKMVWNGNEYGKNLGNEKLKATIPITGYHRSKTTAECEIFHIFGWSDVT
jgi:hypothetical protein